MTSLAAISSNVMANAGENRTINLKIGNNEALVSAFDSIAVFRRSILSYYIEIGRNFSIFLKNK